MFSTFRMGDHAAICIESNTEPPGQRSNQQRFACDMCRSRKLKCTGHKEGCDRCRSREIPCTYLADDTSKKHRRTKRQRSANRSAPAPGSPSNVNSKSNSRIAGNQERVLLDGDPIMTPDQNSNVPRPSLSALEALSPLEYIDADLETFVSTTDPDLFDAHNIFDIGSGFTGPNPDFSIGSGCHSRGSHDRPSHMSYFEKADHPLDCDLHFPSIPSPVGHSSHDKVPVRSSTSDSRTSRPHLRPMNSALEKSGHGGSSLDEPMTPPPSCLSLRSTNQAFSQQKCHPDDDRYVHSSGNGERLQSAPILKQKEGSVSGSKSQPCECMQTVILLHEEVETRKTANMTSGDFLSFQRSVLRESDGVLRCNRCRNVSAISMLLITVCEKLHCSFENTLNILLDTLKYDHPSCPGLRHQRTVFGSKEYEVIDRVKIGRYSVESPQEQAVLIAHLVEIQLRVLRNLLAQLKDIAVHCGWNNHVSKVHQIDQRTRGMLMNLMSATNDALDQF